jgi:hypothetical protein
MISLPLAISEHARSSTQSIQVNLKESGLEMAPNRCSVCIFDKKKGGS